MKKGDITVEVADGVYITGEYIDKYSKSLW